MPFIFFISSDLTIAHRFSRRIVNSYGYKKFTLTDSIAKKITVVNAVKDALHLQNVTTKIARAESISEKFDYIVTRAVAPMNDLLFWSKNKHAKKIIALKGGDLTEELKPIKKNIRIIELKETFNEEFFETKKIVICT